ncbi:MAG: dihydroorotase [Myxococcota bacterium]
MFVIINGHIIDPANNINRKLTLAFEKGKIAFVGNRRDLPKEFNKAEVIDAAGCYVTPGFIDLHTHLRDPGFEYKETIATGSRAAAAGGFTTIVCMPNTEPVNDNAEVTNYIRRKAQREAVINILPAGAITKRLEGKELAEFGEMKEAGVVALTDDGKCVTDAGIMRKAMEYARMLDLPIFIHAQDYSLCGNGVMNEGENSVKFGLPGIPAAAEDVIVARDIELAQLTGARIHIAHCSTQRQTKVIRDAQRRGIKVSAEATPHHLLLTDDMCASYDPNFKMYPPLRTQNDRKALRKALAEGTISAIATDHAPHAENEKLCEFEEALNGVVGLETALPVALDLVEKKNCTLSQTIYALTAGPAKILGLPLGSLSVGADADITIFSTTEKFIVKPENFYSKGRNTPFSGMELRGKVKKTIYHGRVIHES